VYPVVTETETEQRKEKMKELSIQEQTSVTGGVSWAILGSGLGLASAIIGFAGAIGVS
jgi:hypothetical protein